MGGCLSSKSLVDEQQPCAFVVSIKGELLQFPLPIRASQILESLPPNSFFLCNSDALYFDDYIPSLKLEEELESCHVYFVLPNATLQYPLAASDMAALAVKASAALEQITSGRRRLNKTRISPLLVDQDQDQDEVEDPQSNHTVSYNINNRKKKKKKFNDPDHQNKTVSRSASVRKLTRYSSQRAKLAVTSFRMKLTTIYEGSVLHPTF